MEGLFNYQNEGLLKEIAAMPMACNKVWGMEYMLVDSTGFMGKTGGAQYEVIIDMFIKIRLERAAKALEDAPPECWA